jgi:hypothetical protein
LPAQLEFVGAVPAIKQDAALPAPLVQAPGVLRVQRPEEGEGELVARMPQRGEQDSDGRAMQPRPRRALIDSPGAPRDVAVDQVRSLRSGATDEEDMRAKIQPRPVVGPELRHVSSIGPRLTS